LTITDLISLSPQLILLVAGTLVLAVDLILGRENSRRLVPALALAGLLAALVAVFLIRGSDAPVATMLTVDNFALFFQVIALAGMALVVLATMGYIEKRTPYSGEFYALLLAATLAMTVAVGANNLVLIYLGLEFLSITSYVLAGFLRADRRSNEAAMKYFLYGSTASAIMLYGFSLLYGIAGTTDLAGIGRAIATQGPNSLRVLTFPAIVLMLAGLGFKASLVPFHQWAPDTYDGAPTPVAAFLSTASKATGFAILVRLLLTALPMQPAQGDWVAILSAVSMVTMTLGNLIAIRQTNIKRLLAYSSIAQAGYILIGLVAVYLTSGTSVNGVNGLLIYLFAYLFTNVGAFVAVLAVEERTGSIEIKDYAGMIRRSPWLAAVLTIFFLSLAGIPPTGGFLGKFFVFGAAVQVQLLVLAAVGAINSAISAWYYLNVVRVMFVTPGNDESPIRIAPPVQAVLAITVVATLLIGLYPQPFINWATWATQTVQFLAAR
jgi:NADH-quinone oxidoreductase subunit N